MPTYFNWTTQDTTINLGETIILKGNVQFGKSSNSADVNIYEDGVLLETYHTNSPTLDYPYTPTTSGIHTLHYYDTIDCGPLYITVNNTNNNNMTDKVNIKTDIVTPLKETFEQKSKKKTSWSNSPSNDNYPSEKLVKDSLDDKVDKVNGKGLSSNDYTDEYKYQLDNIEAKRLAYDNVNYQTIASEDATTYPDAVRWLYEDGIGNVYLVEDCGLYTRLSDGTVFYNGGEIVTEGQLDDKVDKVSGKGLSTEDFTSALKTKLEGIEAQANKITVDSSLSSTSENPVQNKAIHTALGNKADSSSLSNYILTSKILDDLDNATDNTQVVGALELKTVIANVEAGVPNGVELEANKVSSWSGTTNNTHYPTEKLVKDSLDAKLDDSQLVTTISNTSDNNHMPSAKAVYDYVNSIPKWTTQVANNVASLPQTGSVGVFYLVPNSSSETSNAYDEYFWNESSSSYEKFGTKQIDISNLVTLNDVLEYINNNGELSLSTSGADAGYLVFRIS